MKIFDDCIVKGITSVLHEKKRWVFKPNQAMYSLASKVEALGVRIITGVEVKGFNLSSGSDTVKSVETNLGTIDCGNTVGGKKCWPLGKRLLEYA